MNRSVSAAAAAIALVCAMVASAGAHEFIVRPAQMQVAGGAPLAFEILSAHVFFSRSEELEPASEVAASLAAGERRLPLSLTANAPAFVYSGTASAPAAGTFILRAHRAPQIWATTAQGFRNVGQRGPGMTNVRMYEKFAKALVNVAAGDEGYRQIVGDRLEIVPLANPATIRPGQELQVRVLFDGQPLTARVTATYDGFSPRQDTYAYATEGESDGTAHVMITRPGLWMVRVEHQLAETRPTHDRYVARAGLVFEIR